MALRAFVGILGIVIVLVGLMEIIAPGQIVSLSTSLMRPTAVRALGVMELVLGLLLIAAGLRRVVGLTTYVLILGSYLALLSVVLLVAPDRLIDMVHKSFLDVPPATQTIVLWLSGLLRMLLGAALFWAAMRPRASIGTAPVEHR